jgi:hypothetical protein
MKRFLQAFACSSLLLAAQLAGAQPASAHPENPTVLAKRQLSECMTKHMSVNRTLSYNDAMRECKARMQPPKELASINPAQTGSKAH